jgi:hypothetical protein
MPAPTGPTPITGGRKVDIPRDPWRRSRSRVRESSAQAVAARGGCPAEAPPGVLRPVRIRDRVRFGRKVVAEDELADPGALGDPADFADIGVQRGHPGQLGGVGAMPFEVAEVGHVMDEDVGPRARAIRLSVTAVFLSLAQGELHALRLLADFAAALGGASGICGPTSRGRWRRPTRRIWPRARCSGPAAGSRWRCWPTWRSGAATAAGPPRRW